jgi:hypothetical protein
VRLAPFGHASDSTPIRFVVQDPLNCYEKLLVGLGVLGDLGG